MAQLIKVGMADYKVSNYPSTLISYGLGSCVGIALYDSLNKIGGLAHIMLPDSTQARTTENPAKFADTCLPLMIDEMIKLGATKSRLTAKIAGGAQMFSFNNATPIMRIGDRNIEAVKTILKKLGIRIMADDTGGHSGRTVELDLSGGVFRIKTVDKGEKEI